MPALKPDEIWVMRLDEAMIMLEARAKIEQRGQRQGRPAAAARPSVETRADGSKVYSVSSMADLMALPVFRKA